jgi:serine/threonine-protein kinase
MSDVQAGTVIAGKYRLIQRISGGGMGSVWLAHHGQLDAPVAVKFMHGSLLDMQGARARFEREAKAAAQIRSPYVVHVYDHGIDDETGAPFIVMEYLEGHDLGRRLRGGRRLPLDQAVRNCEQVCKGLHRAHKLGIVHRDLKPGNIFLAERDDDMVKLLDFGIAKETGNKRVVRGETTTTGQVLGSPHYMSPEQARGQVLDGRSDLWSLAVILFRSITGKRPFDGTDIGDLIVRICMDPIPRPSTLNSQLGPVVDSFFERAFSRDQAGRFQTARAFAAEFKAAILGVPVPVDADASGPVAAMSDAVPSSSWDSRSASFTSSLAMEVDDQAPTIATPSYIDGATRTPVDASHTLGALAPARRQSRRRLWLGAGVMLAAGGGVAAAVYMGGPGFASQAAVPSAATTPGASQAAPPVTPPSETAEEEEPPPPPEPASASAAAAPQRAPLARPRAPRPRPQPTPQPPDKPRTDPELGY